MRLTEKTKYLLQQMADTVKLDHNFSLLKSDENYHDLFETADLLGGAVYLSQGGLVTVSRCGKGFLINIPKNGDDGYKLRTFATGLAILYFVMYYGCDPQKFKACKNLDPIAYDTENMEYVTYLACCFICSRHRLADTMSKYKDKKSMTDLKLVANSLGLDEETIEYIGKKYGLISNW